MNYLVTGAWRGLGYAVCHGLGAEAFVRGNVLPQGPYDAIIHCAVNSAKSVRLSEVYGYLDDNFLLTQRLLKIPHKRFVYISTVDIYGRGPGPANSNPELIDKGMYVATKAFSEAIVRKEATKPLILRPTTLLGPSMRPNSIYRMLTEPRCHLFLSGESRFNFVLHDDIVEFIRIALADDIRGIFNLGSSDSIRLDEIARQLNLAPTFGAYTYDVGKIDQREAVKIIRPAFGRPSWQTLNRFIDTLPRYIGKGRLRG